jgi:hypothetical protein
MMISRTDLRRWILSRPLLGRLAAWRQPVRKFLRRRKVVK